MYSDIEINPANLPVDILGLQRFKTEEDTIYSKLLKCLDEAIEVQLESLLGEETLDDPLPVKNTINGNNHFCLRNTIIGFIQD